MYQGMCFTGSRDIEQILETAFRILEELGVLVENTELREMIRDRYPGQAFLKNGRLCFSAGLSQEIFFSGKGKKAERVPSVSCQAEIYEGYYLDPVKGEYQEWTEEKLCSYFSLAKQLQHVDGAHMLGCPLKQSNPAVKPLYEKLYGFKYGIGCGGAIWDLSQCLPIYDICSIYAEEKGVELSRAFSGCVFLLTPLKLGYVEAEQLMWFYRRGLRVEIGLLASLGLSVPVTLAGGMAEHIAEQLFIGVINRVLFHEASFSLSSMLSCADLRNASFQYGRPEQVLMNSALSDIASFYGMEFCAHGGLADAKSPGYEAGVQKISTAMAALMKGNNGHLAGGLLSADEVCSPVQLVLDNEAAGYLKRICAGFKVDQEALAFEAVRECVEENRMFLETEHTLNHWRESLWIPDIFTNQMFSGWAGAKEIDLAAEKAVELSQIPLESEISEDCENKIREVIRKAETGKAGEI